MSPDVNLCCFSPRSGFSSLIAGFGPTSGPTYAYAPPCNYGIHGPTSSTRPPASGHGATTHAPSTAG